MASKSSYSKRLQIDKANATVVVVTAISSFVIVFSLVASKALLSQRSYQSRVINKKEQARDQLKKNIEAKDKLISRYKAFINTSPNLLGGDPDSTLSDRDGNNAQIVLEALPASYDFPSVANSLDKLLTQNVSGLTVQNINGTDDELNQRNLKTSSGSQPVPIPFDITVSGQYSAIMELVRVFESSIRPINISEIHLSGSDTSLTADVRAQTYYQPATGVSITTKVVK